MIDSSSSSGSSMMGQPSPPAWPSDSQGSCAGCGCGSGQLSGEGVAVHGAHFGQTCCCSGGVGGGTPGSGLRPAPLFRALGLGGASSANLPPHRRLRALLQRSHTVVPEASLELSLPAGEWSSSKFGHPESVSDVSSNKPPLRRPLFRACSHPEVLGSRGEEGVAVVASSATCHWSKKDSSSRSSARVPPARSLSLSGIKMEVSVPPQVGVGGGGGAHRPPVRPPPGWAKTWKSSSTVFPEEGGREHGGWRRSVLQEHQREVEKSLTRRKGRRSRIRSQGDQPSTKSGARAANEERQQEAGLCHWLQSLGIGGGRGGEAGGRRDPVATRGTQYGVGGGGRRRGELVRSNSEGQSAVVPGPQSWGGGLGVGVGGVTDGDAQSHQRRDRRPHFLPPIPQRSPSSSSTSTLLDVPLLLPDNSPPPSRSASPHYPLCPLLVPPPPPSPHPPHPPHLLPPMKEERPTLNTLDLSP